MDMSILDYIENLRQKPVTVRRTVAFWLAASVTFFIAVIWFVNLTGSIGGDNNQIASPIESIRESWNNLTK